MGVGVLLVVVVGFLLPSSSFILSNTFICFSSLPADSEALVAGSLSSPVCNSVGSLEPFTGRAKAGGFLPGDNCGSFSRFVVSAIGWPNFLGDDGLGDGCGEPPGDC